MDNADQIAVLLVVVGVIGLIAYSRKWRGSGTAFGTATWASDKVLKAAGMLGKRGLILGRTLKGEVIRIPRYCHILLVAPTGAGKGVSICIPQLLIYRGACVVLDVKGDLYATTLKFRKRLGQVYRLAPFNGGADSLNPLDLIQPGPLLVDQMRAVAGSIVVRTGMEHENHWNDSAEMVITGMGVLVLHAFRGPERSLNSLREIISNAVLLDGAAEKLIAMGGIPARMGNHIKGLQDKERSGVLSTCARHMAFLDSEPVERAVATSSFNPSVLRRPCTVFVQISQDLLEAQRGLLRVWTSTLVKAVSREAESQDPVLILLDEASCLSGLPALEEVLVRGRGHRGGARLLLSYQSDAQVSSAFKDKPTLIYDNCSTKLFFRVNGFETADRVSKMLGNQTIMVESAGRSNSYQHGGCHDTGGEQVSHSRNWAEQPRALLFPEEILGLDGNLLVAFTPDVPPILARRVLWYADELFGTARRTWKRPIRWLLLAIAVALFIAMLCQKP